VLGLVQGADVLELGAAGDAGRDHDQRPGLAEGGADRAHRVLQPRPGGGDDHTGQAGLLRPAVRAVAGTLLVAGGDGADAEVGQRPVQLEVMGARDAEDRRHPVVAQGLEDRAASGVVVRVGHDALLLSRAPWAYRRSPSTQVSSTAIEEIRSASTVSGSSESTAKSAHLPTSREPRSSSRPRETAPS